MRQKRQLIWLTGAIDDLIKLRDERAKRDAEAIPYVAKTINKMAEQVFKSPRVGKPVKTLPDYRDFTVQFGNGGYVLRYRVTNNAIYVAQIRFYSP